MNDSTVLGGVRATEGQGFKAADIIGIGINGVDPSAELSGAGNRLLTLLPSPDVHGYKSSKMLYNWVAKKTLNRQNYRSYRHGTDHA
ncbi:hypothetical protein ACNKHX_11790 [Shigella flexneri]